MQLSVFFMAWDRLEAMWPFGVVRYAPLFIEYGVPSALAGDVDQFLFLDLMRPRFPGIRRVKVEARISRQVFWVYIDLNTMLVSFQRSPLAPLVCSVPISSEPYEFVRLIFRYHLHQERKQEGGRCFDEEYMKRRPRRCE